MSPNTGFRKIRLRGDTEFSQTTHLDGWTENGVESVFGMDAMPNLVRIAEKLPQSAWEELQRQKNKGPPKKTRARRPNYKEQGCGVSVPAFMKPKCGYFGIAASARHQKA